jgi:hypothetical protein
MSRFRCAENRQCRPENGCSFKVIETLENTVGRRAQLHGSVNARLTSQARAAGLKVDEIWSNRHRACSSSSGHDRFGKPLHTFPHHAVLQPKRTRRDHDGLLSAVRRSGFSLRTGGVSRGREAANDHPFLLFGTFARFVAGAFFFNFV